MSITECERRLKLLVAQAWDDEIRWSDIRDWADNFSGKTTDAEQEQVHALFALTRFMYFSRRLTREMLKALYRDHFEAPAIQRIRRNLRNTKDVGLIRQQYAHELASTRFVGLGNPAESGAHLLYVFRQVNYLPKDYFADLLSTFVRKPSRTSPDEIQYEIRNPSIQRIVFFDDIVGSGTQARQYLGEEIKRIRAGDPQFELSFLSLFATSEGLARLNVPELFNGRASCLFELDSSYKAFSQESRYFSDAPDWFKTTAFELMTRQYGSQLQPRWPVGYKDGQILLAFSHNTPDNVPPVFWDQGSNIPWHPVFPRFDKKYA